MFRYPPVVLFFKVANGNHASSGAHGKLLLRGRPTNKGGSTVDSKEHKCWLPAVRSSLPDIGIAV
jgi:hypothetical protein